MLSVNLITVHNYSHPGGFGEAYLGYHSDDAYIDLDDIEDAKSK